MKNTIHLLYFAVVVVIVRSISGDCEISFEDNGVCACRPEMKSGPVTCNGDDTVTIQTCYCMYYDANLNQTILGHCYYSCYKLRGTREKITSSIKFNADICSAYGADYRSGRFCGQCDEDYGLPAYSYEPFSCIPCQDYGYKNWLKYFAVAFVPLTLFYILAVLQSFNVTSSSLNGIVLITQCILSPLQVTVLVGRHNYATLIVIKTVSTVFCIVNLDFFRLLYSPFCLHPRISVIQMFALDYLVALYPFFLIFMTYVLVSAHDREYRLVVWLWKPIKMCVRCHRNTWNVHTSLIEIFASFILLSYVKILGVSIQILAFTATYDVYGNKLQQYYTYYDSTIEYFGSSHLPYAILAITVSSIFVILPFLLLAVYPCRCFHKCLNYFRLRCQALHIFMDAFQGSFRIQPYDLRYFSAFYLLIRILMLIQFQFFPSLQLFFTSGIVSLFSAATVIVFQPYKVKTHNTIDAVLMMLMGVYFISQHAHRLSLSTNMYEDKYISQAIKLVSIGLLLLYCFLLLVWKLAGGKRQTVAGIVKRAWKYVVHVTRRNSREIEGFERELETDEANSYYPPLLRRSQKPT
jgi:hypothetical protein